MPILAQLLLREKHPPSLLSLVAQSQRRPPPHLTYQLILDDRIRRLDFKRSRTKPDVPDEGFDESDVDTSSLTSDDSTTNHSKVRHPLSDDSANGSSDSDNDVFLPPPSPCQQTSDVIESNDLVDCVCYTDATSREVLVFVIKDEALVFRFEKIGDLQCFYLKFTALKAVIGNNNCGSNDSNQSGDSNVTFNLLQRTDSNGVTHIEITRELVNAPTRPERGNKKNNSNTSRNKSEAPPQPSSIETSNIMRGEYVRVNVKSDAIRCNDSNFIAKSNGKIYSNPHPTPSLIQQWSTNSMPRFSTGSLFKKNINSQSSYYVNKSNNLVTTPRLVQQPSFWAASQARIKPPVMTNRLFGLSAKLREFGGVTNNEDYWEKSYSHDTKKGKGYPKSGRNVDGVGTSKTGKGKNEKKVTFSAYATVQVV